MNELAASSVESADALFRDGVRSHGAGDLETAQRRYREALAVDPAEFRAAYNLAMLLLRAGRAAEAVPLFESTVKLDPGRPRNWLGYLESIVDVGRLEEALQLVDNLRGHGLSGAALDKLETRAARTLAEVILQFDRAADAEQLIRRAIEREPNAAEAHGLLGLILSKLRRPAEAETAYRAALALDSRNTTAWSNLGATLVQLRREWEAEACYRAALEAGPSDRAARENLASLLRQQGRLEEARALLRAAAESETSLQAVLPAYLALSPIAASTEDVAQQRADFADGLEALNARPDALTAGGEPMAPPSFNLAYHGRDDRPLMETMAQVLATKVAGLDYRSPGLAGWSHSGARRSRIAIMSDNLNNHTVGHLYRGIIEHLDRSRFEVTVLHGPHSRTDAFRGRIDAAADAAIVLEEGLEAQRAKIEALAPDLLFYPDIGMTLPPYLLAASRLAPVQATAWGHPDTTGLPSLDYFVSADAFEPKDAEAHYTERLVRLSRVPCYLEAPQDPVERPTRAALGLPPTGTLYGCPQTLFKFHPDFDAILAEIAAGDPEGWIVIPAADKPSWTEALRARWARTHPILLDRIHLTPRVSQDRFLASLAHMDVLLDPLHFGSGYTFYLAMGQGVPMVTCRGAYARGRVVAGCYDQMETGGELVASDSRAYVRLALELGRNPEARMRLRTDLRSAARRHLFSDMAAVRALEAFFSAAIAAAARGERLPAGWKA